MAPPLFGQDLRLERRARFPRGEYVFCKLPDGTIAGLPAWMTEAVACIGLDEGTAMPSAGALSELRSLLDSLASRGGASLEKIPEEAINDNTQEDSGGTDEPAAL